MRAAALSIRDVLDAFLDWLGRQYAALNLPPWAAMVVLAGLAAALAAAAWLAVRRARRKRELLLAETCRPSDPLEAELEALRTRRQVRPLANIEETFGLDRLPNGVYGFSLLPLSLDSPVLKTKEARLFEVHKAIDGSLAVVGFVSPQAAATLRTGAEVVDIDVWASPAGEARVPVSIPVAEVLSSRQRRSKEENVLELAVRPMFSWGKPDSPPRKPPQPEAVPGVSARGAGGG